MYISNCHHNTYLQVRIIASHYHTYLLMDTYGRYRTGHSACGPISASWSLMAHVWRFGVVARKSYLSG